MRIRKAHAYGNDFLLVEESDLPPPGDRAALARRSCRQVSTGRRSPAGSATAIAVLAAMA